MYKKLIEVALPLEVINKESAREKSIRHGHPSTLHLWWARRPLAACRAVLFSSLVDDPSSHPDKFPTEEAQEKERKRLFAIIEELVKWENTNNEHLLDQAHAEIMKCCNGNPPQIFDPFCGGGSIPLEAQRLGLEAHAGDLNPVAVLITKALVEIPVKFSNMPPINPEAQKNLDYSSEHHRTQGLAEDVRYYGKWLRDKVEKRIGHIYPQVQLPKEYGEDKGTATAWLWTRTVRCPNSTCGVLIPLVRSFLLSTKPNHQTWVELIIDEHKKSIRFEIKRGVGKPTDPTVNSQGARCIVCNSPVPFDYIRVEGKAKRIEEKLMAIVVEGAKEKIYLPPSKEHEEFIEDITPNDFPTTKLPSSFLNLGVRNYGMNTFADLFTSRQLITLTTFADLISEVHKQVYKDIMDLVSSNYSHSFFHDKTTMTTYADAIATYLGLAVSKIANANCSLAVWSPRLEQSTTAFSKFGLQMSWDFSEVNPLAGVTGSFREAIESISKSIAVLPATTTAYVKQMDTVTATLGNNFYVFTDPPYYDTVPYADLSDFFYIWLRRSLNKVYPDLLTTKLTPKTEELISDSVRCGSREKARQFFEEKFFEAFNNIKSSLNLNYPLTLYLSFKQSEESNEDKVNSGPDLISSNLEAMLEGILQSGFQVNSIWPLRTEVSAVGKNAHNSLATSIIVVCRPRLADAKTISLQGFLSALKRELPAMLKTMQQSNIAPIDFALASIGPGLAVYSRYSKVLETDGSIMPVRTALTFINRVWGEHLPEAIAKKFFNLFDLMRNDGIPSSDYMNELTYLLFFRVAQETGADKHFPEGCRWKDLISKYGTDQVNFYHNLLNNFQCHAERTTRYIFEQAHTQIREPRTLNKITHLIEEIDFSKIGMDTIAEVYDQLLEKNTEDIKTGGGQYFTPRPLIDSIVSIIKPKAGELIHDPALGTGGFLISADKYIKKQTNNLLNLTSQERDFHRFGSFSGTELVPSILSLAIMNNFLHGVEGYFQLEDALLFQEERIKKADVIFSNPPFGQKGSKFIGVYPLPIPTSDCQLNFLQHIYCNLKPGGRAAVVVSDSVLFRSQAGMRVRTDLMEKCNLHTILRLPKGIFYAAGVKANVLFFTRGKTNEGNTKDVWIYDLRTNMPAFSKRLKIGHEHFKDFETVYGTDPFGLAERIDQGEQGRFRRFTREQIREQGDNLDINWLKDVDPSYDITGLKLTDSVVKDANYSLNRALLKNTILEFTDGGKKNKKEFFADKLISHKKALTDKIIRHNSRDILKSLEYMLLLENYVAESDFEFEKLLERAYNVPEKSKGVTTPLASLLLCYYNPQKFSIYTDPVTLRALEYFGAKFPEMPVHKAYTRVSRKYLAEVLLSLREQVIDADYILTDIFMLYIGDKIGVKEVLRKIHRNPDDSCLQAIFDKLDNINKLTLESEINVSALSTQGSEISKEENLYFRVNTWVTSRWFTPEQKKYIWVLSSYYITTGSRNMDDIFLPPLSLLNTLGIGIKLFGKDRVRGIIKDLCEELSKES